MTSQTETVTSSSLRRDNLNPPPQNKSKSNHTIFVKLM